MNSKNINGRISKLLILIFVIISTFSGCDFKFFEPSPEKLMRAPHTTEEQREIYDVVKKDIDSDFKYKYPENGSYRYAYIFKPKLNETDPEEAFVFFQEDIENSDIKMEFIKKIKNKWEAVGNIPGARSSIGIDRVEFANIDGNSESLELIIGFNLPSGKKSLSVYSWETGLAEEIITEYPYYDFALVNENKSVYNRSSTNDLKQLLIISDRMGESNAYIELLTKNIDGEYVVDEAKNRLQLKADNPKDCKLIIEEREDTTLVFVDEIWMEQGQVRTFEEVRRETASTSPIFNQDHQLRTEFFVLQGNSMEQILMEIWETSQRPYDSSFYSRDIDKDGKIEVPTLYGTDRIEVLVDLDAKKADVSAVLWFEVEYKIEKYSTDAIEANFINDMFTIVNEKNDYHFVMPEDWWDNTVIVPKEEGTYLSFITKVTGEEIFSIFSQELATNVNTKIPDGYEYFKSTDLYNYYAKTSINIEDENIIFFMLGDIIDYLMNITSA